MSAVWSNTASVRRTKIIATLGPASASQDGIDALIRAGVDVFRLNFSHGSRDTHQAVYERLRAGGRRVGREVAVMQDLAGTKIRIGRLQKGTAVTLTPGAAFRLVTGDFDGDGERVSTMFAGLARSVVPGNRLLLDDGRIELRVVETDGTEIVTEVAHGGTLGEHKGINAPDVQFSESGLTEKDVQDLKFGIALGVDLVAVSFVQTASDLVEARAIVDEAGSSAWLVAKIERPQAVADIDAILEVADAIMVARGDLGLEIPLEQVPRVQKHLTRTARVQGVPVIIATQVLDTMRVEPRPTRAEVSDAANAVDDGVDAIMLTGETAVGQFPTESIKALDRIIRDAESIPLPPLGADVLASERRHGRALCESAVTLAGASNASAIVAATHFGTTARHLAALRPRIPIYAATESEATERRLRLCWGVVSFRVARDTLALPSMPMSLVETGNIRSGATVVVVRIHSDLTRENANFVSLRTLSAE